MQLWKWMYSLLYKYINNRELIVINLYGEYQDSML